MRMAFSGLWWRYYYDIIIYHQNKVGKSPWTFNFICVICLTVEEEFSFDQSPFFSHFHFYCDTTIDTSIRKPHQWRTIEKLQNTKEMNFKLSVIPKHFSYGLKQQQVIFYFFIYWLMEGMATRANNNHINGVLRENINSLWLQYWESCQWMGTEVTQVLQGRFRTNDGLLSR